MKSDPILAPDDARYRLLVDAITDYAIIMLDRDGRVASWNPGAQRFKGYTAAEIIGQPFERFYTEEDRAAGVPAAALRTAAEQGRYEIEAWRVRKTGERYWAHVLIDPIRGPDGALIGYAKVTRDLSERKAAEESLRRSEEQFRLLVQAVTDYAIYMLDSSGYVSSWNAGAERIKGYSRDEIVGQHFSRFYTEEDREAGVPELALRTAAAAGRFEREGWRVRKDGSRFWAHVVIDPIRDETGGEVIGFAKITRDITERMEAQQSLDKTRAALMQSQKLDAIGQLTGGVAHDFNNLLMAVLGSLELLRKRLPNDPRALALLENAVLGAERGATLTQRMLAFARKQDLRLEGVDVAALVQGITGLLQRTLGPGITLNYHFPRNLPAVHTDANQLETGLLNLVVNARDSMPDGGVIHIEGAVVTVAADSATGLPGGRYVRLSVADEGHGMDADTLSRATEPFYTTKGVGKGTGLGLSMVHGLAEQSGGRLALSSEPGRGTRVELWLPEAQGVGRPRATSPRMGEDAATEPMVVLAVDDDDLVLLNTQAMLEDLGHAVVTARSAEEAMTALRSGRVDLVITDFAMPKITGLQLADSIHATRPHLPVVLATGYAELPEGTAASLPRLAKPYSQADLARILRRVFPLGGRSAA